MKNLFLIILCLSVSVVCFAQHISNPDLLFLQQKEDSLKNYATGIIQDSVDYNRFESDSIFTKMFVRALKTPHSFYYPFDSLQTISILYPADSSFRIFTWQLLINEELVIQHGAIQMNTSDGSLKLFPLIDKSQITLHPEDTVADNRGWIGAVYYRIIEKQNNSGKNYYTLLGYDENTIFSTKKLIDVMTFEDGKPVFGGPYFSFDNDTLVKRKPINRYIIEFKKDASPRLNYDADMDMIIAEHLESETGEPNKKRTLIPDGDYEGFKWYNGKWYHVDKIFNYVTPEGQEPVPQPLKNNTGVLDDKLDNAPAVKTPKKN